jgi:hypothetical protein
MSPWHTCSDVSTAWIEQKQLVRDSHARSLTVPSACGVQFLVVAEIAGANGALCMHTHKGISTQRSDDGEEG